MDSIIELVQRYLHGEIEAEREAAVDDLLSEIYAPLTLFIRSHAAKESAKDVAQETVSAVSENLWLFDGKSTEAFWAWAYGIARRKCADSFRGRQTTLATVADPKLLEEALAPLQDDSTLSAADRADLRAALDLIAASNYPCVGWLWAHYVVGLTFRELGRQEGITEDAASKRVSRCLKLAEELRSK